MILKDLLLKNRSYRRFDQKVRLSEKELAELVGLTCYCASGRNAQPLKYLPVLATSCRICGGEHHGEKPMDC